MSRFTIVMSEILRQGGNEGLEAIQKTRNELLRSDEIEILDFIEGHYRDYGSAPTVDSFKDKYDAYYTERYRGEKLPYLVDLYYKEARADALLGMAQKIETEVGAGGVVNTEEYIRKIQKLPTFNPMPMKDMAQEFDELADDLYSGVNPHSGFFLGLREYQDEEIGALSAGRIFGLLAHKKSGKTTVGSILAVKAFLERHKVLYLTYEMPVKSIQKKMHACLGSFDTKLFRSAAGSADHDDLIEKKGAVKALLDWNTSMGGKLVVKQGVSMPQMREMLIREKKETGRAFDIVFIDGFYLIPAGGTSEDDKWRGVEYNIELLRQYVMGSPELEPFACLFSSQLDPKSEEKGIGITSIDIAKSRALAETADVILAMVKDKDVIPDGRIIIPLENRDGANGISVKAEISMNFLNTMINISKRTTTMGGVYEKLIDIKPIAYGIMTSDEDDEDDEDEKVETVTEEGFLLDGYNEEYVTEETFNQKGFSGITNEILEEENVNEVGSL